MKVTVNVSYAGTFDQIGTDLLPVRVYVSEQNGCVFLFRLVILT